MILFAYAANMNVDEFAKTVPSAKKISIGKLPGYNFVFNKTADDQSSKANIAKSDDANAVIWGVLITLDDNERGSFFNADAWSSDFKLETVTCFDINEQTYQAEVFIAQPHAVNNYLLPYDWYHKRIINLAKNAGLPDDYVTRLSLLPFKNDPDKARRQKRLK